MSNDVLVENVAATRIVTINRPRVRNALTVQTIDALRDAMRDASQDPAVRCVVMGGAGGHFCAGADHRAMLADPSFDSHLETYMAAFHGIIREVVRCPKVVVAMMAGAAVGFGADLAFACDLRVASTDAYAQEKFTQIGLMPDGGGTFWLPRLVGTARAMEMILLADRVDAPELHRLGVVARVVEGGSLRDAALVLARRIESGSPLAFAAVKRALYEASGSLEDALCRAREQQLKLLRTSDFREGVAAWLEKREPRFTGS
ncbi:MAG TPA: enoyl-CoA hydratase-related protein [Polyangiaceae bacterium]|nr:enoyl-CoA hydratase-related protein [Polyangiaceae bacterium]